MSTDSTLDFLKEEIQDLKDTIEISQKEYRSLDEAYINLQRALNEEREMTHQNARSIGWDRERDATWADLADLLVDLLNERDALKKFAANFFPEDHVLLEFLWENHAHGPKGAPVLYFENWSFLTGDADWYLRMDNYYKVFLNRDLVPRLNDLARALVVSKWKESNDKQNNK